MIYVRNSLGSCKSLLLVTTLYSLHTYQIVVDNTPLCDIGRDVSGWLLVTKADSVFVT